MRPLYSVMAACLALQGLAMAVRHHYAQSATARASVTIVQDQGGFLPDGGPIGTGQLSSTDAGTWVHYE